MNSNITRTKSHETTRLGEAKNRLGTPAVKTFCLFFCFQLGRQPPIRERGTKGVLEGEGQITGKSDPRVKRKKKGGG